MTDRSDFSMSPPVPAQQEDSAEGIRQKGVGIAPKEGVPELKLEEIGAPAKGG